jgi:aspartate/methionine/tyrosine aminotransferase
MTQPDISLTTYELLGLHARQFNLTDAHPRYQPVASQKIILDNLTQHYQDAERTPYQELTEQFERAFYCLAKQSMPLTFERSAMLCYSASLCIQIVASYIRSKAFRVALIEPVFDNVSGILKAEEIDLVPLPEEYLQRERIDDYLRAQQVQVVWVTLPNNPTGFTLSENAFRYLSAVCRQHGIMLVADLCFRFFSASMAWDQYAILEEAGVTYAVIEDTGKTWPTQDLKVGMLQASLDVYTALYRYYDNHILNVSPFILHILTRLIEDAQQRGLDTTVRKVILANRETVVEALKGTLLQCQPVQSQVSVAWLKIMDHAVAATSLLELCRQRGIYALPGSNFFWHTPSLGDRFIRLSLVRDIEVMQDAMQRLRAVLLQGPIH